MADKERIVVKIGTSSLIQENGRVNLASIDRLAFTLACVNNQGYQSILVYLRGHRGGASQFWA